MWTKGKEKEQDFLYSGLIDNSMFDIFHKKFIKTNANYK